MPAPPVQPVEPVNPPHAAASSFALPQWSLAAAAAALMLLAVSAWRRARRRPAAAAEVADFDAELDATRSRVLADPRVTADVITLWMRA